MSWQTYVDSNLVGSRQLAQAAICSVTDGSVWAKSAGFGVTQAEVKKILGDWKNLQTTGITVGTAKYLTIHLDDTRSAYGKKGASGVVIVKCKTCVLVGVYADGTQPGNATNVVEKLADYLLENSC